MFSRQCRETIIATFLVVSTANELVHSHHEQASHGRRAEDTENRRRANIETVTNRGQRSLPPMNDGNPPARTSVEEIIARRRLEIA